MCYNMFFSFTKFIITYKKHIFFFFSTPVREIFHSKSHFSPIDISKIPSKIYKYIFSLF